MKILFLSRWFPYPPDNGSKLRIFNVLKQLAHQHEVVLLTFRERADRAGEDDLTALRGFCREVEAFSYRPFHPTGARAILGLLSTRPRYLVDCHSREMAAAVEEAGRRYGVDLVIASQLAMMPYAGLLRGVPALLEELEISSFSGESPSLRWYGRARRRLTWLKLAGYLRRRLPEFAACTVVSAAEERIVRAAVPGYQAVRVVPNAVELSRYVGDFGAPRPNSLVFCGALSYRPNYDALRCFLRDIYPLIVRDIPGVVLQVTGSTSGVDLAALPQPPGVKYTGYVEDIRPVVAQSWLSVVPLRTGGGTRLKILESMALGTPVVSSSRGIEGIEAADGEQAMIADEPAQFAAKVVSLLRSEALRSRLSTAGRALVAERYDWRRIGAELRNLVNGLVPHSRPPAELRQ